MTTQEKLDLMHDLMMYYHNKEDVRYCIYEWMLENIDNFRENINEGEELDKEDLLWCLGDLFQPDFLEDLFDGLEEETIIKLKMAIGSIHWILNENKEVIEAEKKLVQS